MIKHAAIDREVRLEPERFYWAVLDTSAFGRRRPDHQQLGFLFESVLPIPIEQIHAVYSKMSADRYVACGMDREKLQANLADNHNGLLQLGPSSLPAFVDAQVVPETINLLCSEYEPQTVRSMRRRWQLLVMLMVIISAGLLAFGLERRSYVLTKKAEAMQNTKSLMLQQLFGASSSVGGQPPELRLTSELRRLRQTRQEPVNDPQAIDTTDILANLLERWPSDLFVQTESVLVTPTTLTIRANAPSSSDVQLLANAIQSLPGWELQQPQVNTARESVQTTVQMKRQGAPVP